MHPHVFLQRVVVVASFFANPAHEVGHLGVRGHVGAQSGLAAEGFVAKFAGECSLACVGDQVRLQVILVCEQFVAEAALVQTLPAGGLGDPGHLELGAEGVGGAAVLAGVARALAFHV